MTINRSICIILCLFLLTNCESRFNLDGHYHVNYPDIGDHFAHFHIQIRNDSVVDVHHLSKVIAEGRYYMKDSILILPTGHGTQKYKIVDYDTLIVRSDDNEEFILASVPFDLEHQVQDYFYSTGLKISLPLNRRDMDSRIRLDKIYFPIYFSSHTFDNNAISHSSYYYSTGYGYSRFEEIDRLNTQFENFKVKYPKRLHENIIPALYIDMDISRKDCNAILSELARHDFESVDVAYRNPTNADSFKIVYDNKIINKDSIYSDQFNRISGNSELIASYEEKFVEKIRKIQFWSLSLSEALRSNMSNYEIRLYLDVVPEEVYEYEISNLLIRLYSYHLRRSHQSYAIAGNNEDEAGILLRNLICKYNLDKYEHLTSGIIAELIHSGRIEKYDLDIYDSMQEIVRDLEQKYIEAVPNSRLFTGQN